MLHPKLMALWPLFLLTLLSPLAACGTTRAIETPPHQLNALPIELLDPCLNLRPPSSTSPTQRAVASDRTQSTPTEIACWTGATRFRQEYEARVER